MTRRRKRITALVMIGLMIFLTAGSSVSAAKENDNNIKTEDVVKDTKDSEEMSDTGTEEDLNEGQSPDNSSVSVIAEWSWLDGDEILIWSEENERWEAAFPGAGKENPLTQDILQEMLPAEVAAKTAEEDGTNIPVTWELSAIGEGVYEGETSITAKLAEGWTFSDGTDSLGVTVIAGGAELLDVSDQVLQNNMVETVSPKGTTIDLFNYYADQGINDGHQLEFGTGTGNINANRWTGYIGGNQGLDSPYPDSYANGVRPLQGIVQDKLVNGYPILQTDGETGIGNLTTGITVEESLAYLFNEEAHSGKDVYMGVKNLLQINEKGYFYYDSKKNFSEFDAGTNSFRVYNQPALNTNDAKHSTPGWFFPFNDANTVFDEGENGTLTYADRNPGNLDYHFGVHMSTRFIQQYEGHTAPEGETGREVVHYTFSGDDDVWVYIDDILVADLGGIHDAVGLDIDFSTGQIQIYRMKLTEDGNKDVLNEPGQVLVNTTIKAVMSKYIPDESYYRGNTLADDTYHTLDFFYLERGQGASNMSLEFNLVEIPETDIIKIDQLGNAISGAGFTLYAANENYVYNAESGYIASGVTGSDGTFILTDDEGNTLSLKDLYTKDIRYLVLKETQIPLGYRSPEEIDLQLIQNDKGQVIMICQNPLESGAYASAKVTTTATDQVYRFEDSGQECDYKNRGTLFAVVMKYKGDPEDESGLTNVQNWVPVYGSELDGWNEGAEYTMAEIVKSAQAYPYEFRVTASGSYKVEIDNLPGDIRDYYYMQDSTTAHRNVRYSVGYFYTEANDIAGATGSNTYRVIEEEFDREFSARLFVPNIGNYFLVQKLDESGNPIPIEQGSAAFELYTAEMVTDNGNGNYALIEGAVPMDTQTTRNMDKAAGDFLTMSSVAGFPSVSIGNDGAVHIDKPLAPGTYYVRESQAPPGYKVSDKLMKVVITNDGIYADAGTENDGITVELGVGSIVKSLLQYTNGDVDATLADIAAELNTSSTADKESWISTGKTMHLIYGSSGSLLEFGPPEEQDKVDTDVAWPHGFTTDIGFSTLKVSQWYEGPAWNEQTGDASNKGEVTAFSDLSHLFAETVVIQVENEKIGSLTVSKEVTGTDPPEGQEFVFDIELTDTQGAPVNGAYPAVKSDGTNTTDVNLDIQNGKARTTLKHGESLHMEGLAGYTWKVTETPITNVKDGFTTQVSVDGAVAANGVTGEGTVPTDGDSTVVFTNAYYRNFTFTKVNSEKAPLTGAAFVLYELKCKEPGSHSHDGNLEVDESGQIKDSAEAECWTRIGTSVSGEDGNVSINRLYSTESEYRLIEYKAPDGYMIPEGQWKITYDSTEKQFTAEQGQIGRPIAFEEVEGVDGEKSYQLSNYKPDELPFTGNTGIKAILIAGFALMILGGIGMVCFCRRGRNAGRVHNRRRKRK